MSTAVVRLCLAAEIISSLMLFYNPIFGIVLLAFNTSAIVLLGVHETLQMTSSARKDDPKV